MNRLQKKCFVASAGFHLLMLAILFIGPAFLSSSKPTDDRPPINFVPPRTIDEAFSGGGNPKAAPPASTPAPAPAPAKVETPQPAIEKPLPPQPKPRVEKIEPPKIEKAETPDRDAFDTKPAKKLPEVSLKPVVRSKNATPKAKPQAGTDSQADAADEQRNRNASLAKNLASDLRHGLSSPTTIEMNFGPGGGGVPYANFRDAVKKVYDDAWLVPDGVTDDEAVATASVTIARDGSVVDARIIRRSGNALADQSVEMVLRRVTFVAPLPEGAKESQRTVTIKFSVKAKRGTG